MKTQTLKPYPEYAASSLPWLAEMPKHWAAERAKWLFQRMDRPVRPDDDVVTCFRDGIVTLRKKRRVGGFTESLKEIGYQGVREGDLVIHAMDAFAGAAGVSDSDGKCTPVYAVCQPKQDVDPRYYAHIVREMARMQWIAALAKGIRERSTDFRFDDFAGQVVPVPSKEEQNAIVAFLAHADRWINRLIRAKRRLIELLNEQKQAIIHRAVTRGLDANAPLKPSGIEWLGDIPEHWEVGRLGRHIKLTTGFPFESQSFSLAEGDIRLLRGINVLPGKVRWESVVRWPASQIDAFSQFALHAGDVVLGMDRPIVNAGIRVAIVHEEDTPALLLQRVARLRSLADLDNIYLALLLSGRTFSNYLAPIFTGVSVPHISPEQIRSFPVALPPLNEQLAIVGLVENNTRAIERASNRASRQMDLMREYRTRLIADVVTGKLDVRGMELPALDEDEMIGEWDGGTEEEAEEVAETEEIALADV